MSASIADAECHRHSHVPLYRWLHASNLLHTLPSMRGGKGGRRWPPLWASATVGVVGAAAGVVGATTRGAAGSSSVAGTSSITSAQLTCVLFELRADTGATGAADTGTTWVAGTGTTRVSDTGATGGAIADADADITKNTAVSGYNFFSISCMENLGVDKKSFFFNICQLSIYLTK
jgi:hypothetical protein